MKILIAVDGTEFSKFAVEKCCQMILNPEDTSIEIVSAAQPTTLVPTEPFAISAEYMREVDSAVRNQAEKFVAEAESIIQKKFPDTVLDLTTKVLTGTAARAIVEEAEDWGADLIVMGSHGYGFWKRMVIGSVSQSVIQNASCSVLIFRTPEYQNVKKD